MRTYKVAWNLREMQTLSALAIQRDRMVAKERQDEVVHARFFELARWTSTSKRGRSFDIVFQEVGDI